MYQKKRRRRKKATTKQKNPENICGCASHYGYKTQIFRKGGKTVVGDLVMSDICASALLCPNFAF